MQILSNTDFKGNKVFNFARSVPAALAAHPESSVETTALSRSITALYAYSGKVWAGYGDTFENTGAVGLREWDPALGSWGTTAQVASTNRVGRFRPVGNSLWAAHDDPTGTTVTNTLGRSIVTGTGLGQTMVSGTAINLLSANASSVETDITPWVISAGATGVQDTVGVGVDGGTKSLKITRDGTVGPGNVTLAEVERIPCTPGKFYGALCTYQPYATSNGYLTFIWYDSVGAVVSETLGPALSALTTGTQIYGNGVAPTGAVEMGIRVGSGTANFGGTGFASFDKWQITELNHQVWIIGGSSKTSNLLPVHLYDFTERVAGDIYTVGNFGVTGGGSLLRSVDGGAIWTEVVTRIGPTLRFYNVGTLNGSVYTVIGDTLNGSTPQESYVHDKGEQCYRWDNVSLTRGPVLDGFIKPLTFANRMVYLSINSRLLAYDGLETVTELREVGCVDHCIDGAFLYVLQRGSIYRTTDLLVWEYFASAPSIAVSLAVLTSGNTTTAFVGTTESNLWACEQSGVPKGDIGSPGTPGGPQGERGFTGIQGPGNLFVQDIAPADPGFPYMWVQTGIGDQDDYSIWIEDGV